MKGTAPLLPLKSRGKGESALSTLPFDIILSYCLLTFVLLSGSTLPLTSGIHHLPLKTKF